MNCIVCGRPIEGGRSQVAPPSESKYCPKCRAERRRRAKLKYTWRSEFDDILKAQYCGGLNQRSQREAFGRVMRELGAISTKGPEIDPFVEQLRKCPDTFVAGEMLARMFDALRYEVAQIEDERLLPPACVVLPLV